MPLQSIDGPACDEGQFFSFVMKAATTLVRCHVHHDALDTIEQTMTGDERDRLDRFHRHRTAFEAVASDLFDAGLPLRVTADHMIRLRTFESSHRQTVA